MVFLNDIKTGNIIVEQVKFFFLSFKLLKNKNNNNKKTIEDRREKQVKVIKDNEKRLANNTIVNGYKNKLLLSKEREIFKNIYNERLNKLEELTKKN